MLSLRSLDSLESRVLQGTNGALYPFWSPDSQFIGFGADGTVKRIGVSGGYPEKLCNIPNDQLFRGGTWSSRDVIAFASAKGPIYQIAATGGKPAAVTEVDESRQESTHRHPFFLPDGRHFLFTIRSQSPVVRGRMENRLWIRRSGPDWLTGGAFGPEASVVTVGVCVLIGLYFIVMTIRRRRWMPLSFRMMLD